MHPLMGQMVLGGGKPATPLPSGGRVVVTVRLSDFGISGDSLVRLTMLDPPAVFNNPDWSREVSAQSVAGVATLEVPPSSVVGNYLLNPSPGQYFRIGVSDGGGSAYGMVLTD